MLRVAGGEFVIPGIREGSATPAAVQVSVRPEQFILDPHATDGIPATVDHSIFLGLNTHHVLRLTDGTVVEVTHESELEDVLEPCARVFLDVKRHKVNVYSQDGETNLTGVLGAVPAREAVAAS
nr:TOBE domain-containing protein [Tessaracoccus coleopterorum]